MSKLLFFVTEDYYFVSHRLPLAVAAHAAGYEVCVVTRVQQAAAIIEAAGVRVIPFDNARSSLNPLNDLRTLYRLVRLYRREQPDIVHHVAMKPVLYGSIAARLTSRALIVNAFAGMGWLFTSPAGLARWIMPMVRGVLGRAVSTGIALVQNPDDERLLVQLGVPRRQIRRIAGSGVDLERFHPTAEPEGLPVVVLPARLLADKGVEEFVAAARLLRQKGVAAQFILAGEPDPINPTSIPGARVAEWVDEGIIQYKGYVADVAGLLAQSHIVCLPSYREGLPKSLIEAAAAGRPIVTTDVPGCREVVTDGDNGLLVPARDAGALADALQRLIGDAALRRRMGTRGRLRAEQEFGLETVIRQTLELYREAQA